MIDETKNIVVVSFKEPVLFGDHELSAVWCDRVTAAEDLPGFLEMQRAGATKAVIPFSNILGCVTEPRKKAETAS